MSEDYRRTRLSMQVVRNMVLTDIRNMLQSMGKDIKSYPLPEIDEEHDSSHGVDREIYEESIIEVDPNHETLVTSLNASGGLAYNEILAVVDSGEGGVFFVDGPGGTGKTFLYKALLATVRGLDYITSRAILSTRNDCVDRINMRMIHRFRGEEMVYHSFDRADDDPHNYYPPEFLNSLTPNGLPPHVLRLKINCPVILLRNIDPANELCNGTRLIVRGFQKNAIDAEIVLRLIR
ncbi:hypothetical protein U9M48_035125 [Paspalum notatum var. saurae]|uniref:ATP-dependent DNA helicase n=1 Tax=Paspalum notatum var. saurae TaxID=547442 RepID=A0AAQ3UE66_PASNO